MTTATIDPYRTGSIHTHKNKHTSVVVPSRVYGTIDVPKSKTGIPKNPCKPLGEGRALQPRNTFQNIDGIVYGAIQGGMVESL